MEGTTAMLMGAPAASASLRICVRALLKFVALKLW